MVQLSSFGRLTIDIRKLEDYCLDPRHPRGRHKARVFQRALGLSRDDAAWLRDALLREAPGADASEIANDRFGLRLQLDTLLARQERQAMVRSLWIVENGAGPRLVTCWVL